MTSDTFENLKIEHTCFVKNKSYIIRFFNQLNSQGTKEWIILFPISVGIPPAVIKDFGKEDARLEGRRMLVNYLGIKDNIAFSAEELEWMTNEVGA